MTASLPPLVRLDPALGMAGVFRPIGKSPRRLPLDLRKPWGEAELHWRGPEQLGIADQSVLLATVALVQGALGGPGGDELLTGDEDVLKRLGLIGHRFRHDTVWLPTSFRAISRLCADHAQLGPNTQQVRACLRRLAETTVWMRRGDEEGACRLLAWTYSRQQHVLLALNWRLVEALCGSHYVGLDLQERIRLDGEVAKALHFSLTCQLNRGSSWAFRLDSLQARVWGDQVDGDALRQRRRRLRHALSALHDLGTWTVTWEDNKIDILRGRRPTSEQAAGASNRLRRTTSVTVREIAPPGASERFGPTARKSLPVNDLALADVSVLFSTR